MDPPVGVAVGEVVVEEPGQLGELLREVVGALVQPVGAAQGGGGSGTAPFWLLEMFESRADSKGDTVIQ